jgi:hypothetical protein
MANEKNLIPQNMRTKEEQRKIARQGGIASGVVRKEKKLMSQIYAEFLEKEHDVEVGGEKKKLSGHKIVSAMMMRVLNRGDAASVSIMKEIREGTEGSKIKHDIEGLAATEKRIIDYMKPEDIDDLAKQIKE